MSAVEQLDRAPYVGSGEAGCRRSARIDREEADGLSWADERSRSRQLHDSANRWDDQAHRLMLERVGPRPTLDQVRTGVGNEDLLAALALLDLSPAVAGDAARFTEWSRDGRYIPTTGDVDDVVLQPDPGLDWEAWVADVDSRGRGWSSTEWRLYDLVAALAADRPMQLKGVLDGMNSWERDALAVLVQWASGGNNRDLPGRLTITKA